MYMSRERRSRRRRVLYSRVGARVESSIYFFFFCPPQAPRPPPAPSTNPRDLRARARAVFFVRPRIGICRQKTKYFFINYIHTAITPITIKSTRHGERVRVKTKKNVDDRVLITTIIIICVFRILAFSSIRYRIRSLFVMEFRSKRIYKKNVFYFVSSPPPIQSTARPFTRFP